MANRKLCLLTYQSSVIYEARSLAITYSFEFVLSTGIASTRYQKRYVVMLHVLQPQVYKLSMPSSWMSDL